MTDTRIYRYIVAVDGGTAPNPFDGYCTLAICKPAIRRTARAGDWVMGFRAGHRGEVLYAMQIGESLSFAEYWNDPRFFKRRPDEQAVPTDNIYRPIQTLGDVRYEWVENAVHGPDAAKRDLGGKRVLIAKQFWYFGRDSKLLNPDLIHLAPVTQGHVVRKHRKSDDVERLVRWLQAYPKGLQGHPVHWKGPFKQLDVGRGCSRWELQQQ